MSILCVGDLHYQPKTKEIMAVVEAEIMRVVAERSPKMIVILGDLLHSHGKIDLGTLAMCTTFMLRLAGTCEKLLILIGNHDRTSNSVIDYDTHAFRGLHRDNISVIDRPTLLGLGETKICAIPYLPKGMMLGQLSDMKVEECDLVFAHQDIRGGLMGTIKCKDGDVWPQTYPLLISGHYHDMHRVADNVVYVGTPYQTTFGESAKKYLAMWTPENLEFIEMKKVPKKITYHIEDLVELETLRFSARHQYRVVIRTSNRGILKCIDKSDYPGVKFVVDFVKEESEGESDEENLEETIDVLLKSHVHSLGFGALYDEIINT